MLNANFGSTERFHLIFSFLGRVIRDTFGDVLLKRFKIVLYYEQSLTFGNSSYESKNSVRNKSLGRIKAANIAMLNSSALNVTCKWLSHKLFFNI